MPRPDNPADELTVVATAAGLQQADVIRATLEAAGIDAVILGEHAASTLSHLGSAIHPGGVPIAVRRGDVPPAQQVLGLQGPDEEAPSLARRKLSTDEYASSALLTAKFACIFPPLMPVTLYLFLRAARAARNHPPADPYTFRRKLFYTFLLGVLIPAALIAITVAVTFPHV